MPKALLISLKKGKTDKNYVLPFCLTHNKQQ